MRRSFNADLSLTDERGTARPYLAEAIPELNSETWRVFPDGRMETTWKLRPGIVWQDGVPLTAQDFVFAWQVYSTPELGVAGAPSTRATQDVAAPDDRTLVIHWRQPYPNADIMAGPDGLPPLPRHILEQAFQQQDATTFASHRYWTADYVGLGPFRMVNWEHGSFLEGEAFDQHVLGRAKIDRIKILFIGDANAALAYLLGGELDLAADSSIGPQQAAALMGQWGQTGAGSSLLNASNYQGTAFQFRPELATPQALLDVRVRRALAHTVVKQSLSETVYSGQMSVADFVTLPLSKWSRAVEGSIVKYPVDLRRSEQLMNEAGFLKDADGFYSSSAGGRFRVELKVSDSPDWVAQMTIMASDWRKAGFDIQDAVLPAALSTDPPSRNAFPGMYLQITGGSESTLDAFTTAAIPHPPAYRPGNNRGGWSNPEYDRWNEAWNTSLVRSERERHVAQMAKIFTEQLPHIPILFLGNPYAYVASLHGIVSVGPETSIPWNIHEWDFK